MGGSVSRFEETDWHSASGKLVSGKQTIDGAQPTSKYGVYTLHKCAVNQREYDITDSDSNLLYTTRCIEGTLTWFDVMGPGLDQYLLRVQVDLSRRYWVVYRFGAPAYSGQFADMTATKRFRESRGHYQPSLFKKCAITVSWDRYSAIVHNYGPPIQHSKNSPGNNYSDDDDDDDDERLSTSSSNNKRGGSCHMDSYSNDSRVTQIKKEPYTNLITNMILTSSFSSYKNEETKTSSNEKALTKSLIERECSFDENQSTSLDSDSTKMRRKQQTSSAHSNDRQRLTDLDTIRNDKNRKAQVKKERSFLFKMKDFIDKSPHPKPEGNLQLDNPILKCVEINSFSGQHQTMLVGKEEAKKIKKMTIEAAEELGTDAYDPNTNLKSGVSEVAPPTKSEEPPPLMREDIAGESSKDASGFENRAGWARSSSDGPNIGDAESQGEPPNKWNGKQQQFSPREEGIIGSRSFDFETDIISTEGVEEFKEEASEKDSSSDEGKKEKDADLDPLIGFWSWDNTMRVHKMNLHVAEGSDLALHVVLAVVTNQLRFERNVFMWTM